MNILIIEDNPDIVANLYEYFEPLGHELDNARTGLAGLRLAEERQYDIIILDGMLPGMDGLEVCANIRAGRHTDVPILMLTARDTTQDKVNGFSSGADDYLVKPYSLLELDARINALNRRASKSMGRQIIQYGELRADFGQYEFTRNGQLLDLTPLGYKIMAALIRAAPKVVTREALEQELWQDNPPMSDALRSHVHILRQVVDKPFPNSKPMLITVQGTGFRLGGVDEES
ncbi:MULTISPECIES: response regulator transcription factor [Pseudomonas]|uniref:Response regulator transcription factor n=1 Tax=Pseudomonas aphyarum TaxID=2942629 RepID=A0ABT5PPS0_9PSED|nr:response regulator transcription factor [Pseudomonas aphyarum]MDD0971121.1 response regulator transcription factor [Pseudomonas aphyarum]MDD1125913.1 response regulator transcription factor [Pseudomonas aphyarum]